MDGVSEGQRRKAVGVHVFAGGLTGGIQQVFDVVAHLERYDFGLETSRRVWGVDPVISAPPEEWPRVDADLCFANPKCTAWSCTTAGYSSDGHGVNAKQCEGTHDVMKYAIGKYPVIALESVNQAYSTGSALFAAYTEHARLKGYRVAHVFVNGATFGSAQQRRRYFYILYPADKQFNVNLPKISSYYPVLYDVIGHVRERAVEPWDRRSADYHRDSYPLLSADDQHVIPSLPTGWNLNTLAEYDSAAVTDKHRKKWAGRYSNMPFSMHSVSRCSWLRPCPTLQSSSTRLIHPWHDRPFTVGELSMLMGWGDKIPVGRDPVAQLAKGVVPAVGQWLAEQCLACLDDAWNGEEWTTRYDRKNGQFDGEDSRDMLEKVIDVSGYVGQQFDIERYPQEIKDQFRSFNVHPMTGKLIKSWKSIIRQQ